MTASGAPPEAAPRNIAPPEPADRQAAAGLLTWFASAKRALPWREHYEAYSVWISEMMLQQTQVDTMLPYYDRWMKRFPTIAAVAQAPQEAVLKAWEGLGYYSRARNLQRAAQAIVALHGGTIPDDPDTLRGLPGIGPYSAGAIASIAFNRPEPLVDGNVARVLGRWLAVPADLSHPTGRAVIWSAAARLLTAAGAAGGHPRDFNQALMELGALICRPRAPQCLLCPWQDTCRARALGDPEAFPRKPERKVRPIRRGIMLLACRATGDGEAAWLMRLRPPRGIWGGLWEFPWIEYQGEEDSAASLCGDLLAEAGEAAAQRAAAPLGHVSHGLTHFQLELDCLMLPLDGKMREGSPAQPRFRWVTRQEIASLPLARLSHKALALLERDRAARAKRQSEPPSFA